MLLESIRLAVSAIKANKMRSFLTMLGIIIGISSVISITAIGACAEAAVNQQFQNAGTGYMYIMLNWEKVGDYVEYNDLFYDDDFDAVREKFADEVGYIAPYIYSYATGKAGKTDGELSITGVEAGYNNFVKMDMLYGRMIGESDVRAARNSIVIDTKAAMHYFNKENAVGEVLEVNMDGNIQDMNVVGVYSIPETIFSTLDPSSRYSCYIPYTVLWNDDGTTYMEIYTVDGADLDVTAEKMIQYIEKIKDKESGFYTYESAAGQMAMISQVLNILSIAIGAIAAISLLVGGIGIMNIMLVSVTERTREIGIRKALGARTKDILLQFLVESMIISIIGGVIGTVLGAGLPVIVISILGMPVALNPAVIVGAVAFSGAVGVFFGLFPARKAAKLDPIEALRYE